MKEKYVKKVVRTKEEVILLYEDDTCELLLRADPEKMFIRPLGLQKDRKYTRKDIEEIYSRGTMVIPKEQFEKQLDKMRENPHSIHKRWFHG